MMLLTVFLISSFIRFVVINPSYYLDILHMKNSEEKIYDMIKENLDYALIKSNLSKELVSDIISKEEIKGKCDSQFENIIVYLKTGENKSQAVDTELYLKRFDEKLNVYVNENSIKVDDKFNKDIKELRGELGQIIENGIDIISYDIVSKSSSINKVALITSRFATNIYYLFYPLIAIMALSLLAIWHKEIGNGLRWISRAFISAGILFSLIFSSGLISGFYENVIIYTPYLKEFISEVVRKGLVWLFTGGIIILSIGIVIYIGQLILSNNKNKLEIQ